MQRLDVGTSGLMVVAKSEIAYTVLKQAFRSRTVDKTYHALVQGHPDPFRGTIEAPIGRHPTAEYKMAIIASGRHSVTHYETLEAHLGTTLLEVSLETGRTHQIRVHMAAIRHPCVGDPMYGSDPMLAARLGSEPPVAARRTTRVRAPDQWRRTGVHLPVPRRSAGTRWTLVDDPHTRGHR